MSLKNKSILMNLMYFDLLEAFQPKTHLNIGIFNEVQGLQNCAVCNFNNFCSLNLGQQKPNGKRITSGVQN